jgi:hypothetical protein
MLGAVLGLSLIAAVAQPLSAIDAAPAGPLALGSPSARVARAFPQAHATETDRGERALELVDVDYGGSRWSKVDFVLDSGGRLARVRLSTRAMTFAELRARLQARYDSYVTAAEALGVAAPATDDLQLRICQSGDGSVSLTYEKPTVAL